MTKYRHWTNEENILLLEESLKTKSNTKIAKSLNKIFHNRRKRTNVSSQIGVMKKRNNSAEISTILEKLKRDTKTSYNNSSEFDETLFLLNERINERPYSEISKDLFNKMGIKIQKGSLSMRMTRLKQEYASENLQTILEMYKNNTKSKKVIHNIYPSESNTNLSFKGSFEKILSDFDHLNLSKIFRKRENLVYENLKAQANKISSMDNSNKYSSNVIDDILKSGNKKEIENLIKYLEKIKDLKEKDNGLLKELNFVMIDFSKKGNLILPIEYMGNRKSEKTLSSEIYDSTSFLLNESGVENLKNKFFKGLEILTYSNSEQIDLKQFEEDLNKLITPSFLEHNLETKINVIKDAPFYSFLYE